MYSNKLAKNKRCSVDRCL